MNDLLPESPQSPERERKPLRIIYIEDDKRNRNLIEEVFEKHSNDIKRMESFASTEDAEKYLIDSKDKNEDLPDAIVSDNDLGGGKRKGADFAMYLKEQGVKIPFVLFASNVGHFRYMSEENLHKIGLTKVVDKIVEGSPTEILVNVLKEINSSSKGRS